MDIETRRKKQQALIVQLLERKVRSRAQQIYEMRGEVEGQDLQDWFQAESEILENNIIAPLYRRLHNGEQSAVEVGIDSAFAGSDTSALESSA